MARIALILFLIVIVFTIFALVDCVRARDSQVRGLPKALWAVLIVIIAPLGGLLWFALGKDRGRSAARAGGPIAPDDDPAFLRQLGEDKRREETIRDLERRLSELDDDSDGQKK